MLSDLRISCKNKAEGCTEELALDKIDDHESIEC
jgi:hypothetical protein